MGETASLVSVTMTSFQHAKYISEAIDSILSQTHSNIELIVVDDGSDDGTRGVVAKVRDPRLTYRWQENAGPSSAMNSAIALARGDFIALMSADDVCEPSRIEQQLVALRDGELDGVFSRPTLIDDRGKIRPDTDVPPFFAHRGQSSVEILRTLFFQGNFVCAPSAMIRAHVLRDCGLFHPALYQLQDFEMWIRLAAIARLAVIDQRLVRYRLRDAHANLSDLWHSGRIQFEKRWIYRRFFDICGSEAMEDTFAEELELWCSREPRDKVERRAAMLYLLHTEPSVRSIGLSRLLDLFPPEHGQADFAGLSISAKELAEMIETAA